MKKILIVALASTAFVSAPAFAADTDDQDVVVNATVNNECSVENPDDVTFTSVNINEAPGEDALFLKNGSQRDDQNIWVSCNYAANLNVTSDNGALLNQAGAALLAIDPDDFTNRIHYRVQLGEPGDTTFPYMDFRTRINGTTKTITAGGAFHDEARLRILIDADDTNLGIGKRPVAGDYTDTATLTVGVV